MLLAAPSAWRGLLLACFPLCASQECLWRDHIESGDTEVEVCRCWEKRLCWHEAVSSRLAAESPRDWRLGVGQHLALVQTELQVTSHDAPADHRLGPPAAHARGRRSARDAKASDAGEATWPLSAPYANDAPSKAGPEAPASVPGLNETVNKSLGLNRPVNGRKTPPANWMIQSAFGRPTPGKGDRDSLQKKNKKRPFNDWWFDVGNKEPWKGKAGQRVSVGKYPKLDHWGVTGTQRRTRYYFPVAFFAFTGMIFALMHVHRSPWQPPKDSEEPVSKANSQPRLPSRASSRSGSRHPTFQSEVLGSSEKGSLTGAERESVSTEESVSSMTGTRPTLRRRKTEYGFVDKMFLKHWNRSFGDNAQLTVRGAMLALIAGLPLILPDFYIPTLQQFQKTGFWSVGGITMFIFTLWKTVGETLAFAWNGIFGTFMATFNIWIMFGLFPGGVSEVSEPYVFWVAVVNGCTFIPLVLWFNWDDNTKIFALMNFVWYWMAFLDPDRLDVYSQGFVLTNGSSEVSSMLAAISGCGLAVMATLLPFPLWALGKGCKGSHEIVGKLGFLWGNAMDYYCSPQGQIFETDRLVQELMDLHQQMDVIHTHIRNSWWECFGLGHWQRVRLMLRRLTVVLQDEFDLLYCILNTSLIIERNDKELEVFIMLEDRIRDVITEAQWLLNKSASAACRGGFSPAEVESVQRGIVRIDEAVTNLTIDFREIKQEGGGPKLSEGLLDEHAFCYNLCALGRLAIKFTQDLLKVQKDGNTKHLPKIQESVGFWGVFDRRVLFDPHYLVYVGRTSLRILMCFVLGYHGYSNVVRGKNAGIAVPATLLLMRYTGSAIQKNAKRLQAVVLGTVTGILIHAIVSRCVWWGYLLTGILYFLWLLLTLFIYFDAIDNSYSGLLMAYFGTMGILRGCNDNTFDPALTHYPITNTVVAISVVTFFDTIFGRGRAALAAYEAYMDVWRNLKEAVQAIFDPKDKNVEFHRDKIMSLVVYAESLGAEAAVEPRWWRIPWRTHLYDKAIQNAYQLCAILSNMERTVARGGRDGASKEDVFQALLYSPAFQGLGSVLLAKMTQMETLLKIFVHETTGPMAELDAPAMLVGYLRDETEARRKFFEEVNKLEEFGSMEGVSSSPSSILSDKTPKDSGPPMSSQEDMKASLKRRLSYNFQVDSLEADPASQVSLLLSDIDHMIRTMRFLHHTVLRN